MKYFLMVVLAFALFSGCVPKISTNVMMPAESHEAAETKNIAVLPFDGNYGSETTAEFENILSNVQVDGKKYFTVVDRQNIQKTISEQKLQLSGAIDDKTAVKLGRLTGAAGVYTGSSVYFVRDEYFSETRSSCAASDKKGKCLSYTSYAVSCTKRTVELTIVPKLIDISTGQVRYTSRLGGSDYSSRCSDSSSPLETGESLLRQMLRSAAEEFRRDVAPYTASVSLELMDDKDGITDGKGLDDLKYSIEFAKSGRLDRACEIWKGGGEKYPASISFVYNTGVCHEAQGRLEEALGQYQKADRLLKRPDKTVNSALMRVRTRMENQEKLSKQLK